MPKQSDDDSNDESQSEESVSNSSGSSSSSGSGSSSSSGSDSEDQSTPTKKTPPGRPQRRSASSASGSKPSRLSESSDDEEERTVVSQPPVRRATVQPGQRVAHKPAAIVEASRRRVAPVVTSSGHQTVQLQQRKSNPRKYTNSSEDESSNSDSDSKRPTTRRKGASVSYKEDSAEETGSEDLVEVDWSLEAASAPVETDNAETIERIIETRLGRKGATGPSTTIYTMEESGDPNTNFDSDLERDKAEQQYLIKWQGWSHIHNTWESEHTLRDQKVKGLKKLENYMKKEDEIRIWKARVSPEDVEYFECQQELQLELLSSYMRAERIIAETQKPDSEYPDYLIKWESLPYSEATWEDGALIVKKYSYKIREFREREDSKRTPSKLCRALKSRPKFLPLKEQPEYIGGDATYVLRDYQLNGLNWLVHAWSKENSVILADEMGLGKTIQTISFLNYLFHAQQLYGPFLVVVPLSTMNAWQKEFAQWAPNINVVVYIGDMISREVIRQREWCHPGNKRLKFNALLTTYEILLKDKAFLGAVSWAVLMVDEAHRLKNDDSLLYKSLKEFDTNHRLLITGTPLQNSLKELWSLLYFIMPDRFDSWDTFEHEHGNAEQKGYSRLHKQLEPYILRRVKKDVEKSLPAKVEQILRVDMTALQKQYYKWILTKNYAALRKGNKGSASTFVNIVMELKKCCNHAFLTKPQENEARYGSKEQLQQLIRGSGKLVLLDKLLVRLKETGHRVLIFSQMVRMLDLISEYLQLRHFPFQRLDGGIKGELRRKALEHFNAEGSQDFCFLLSTRAGGLGINLATADTVIIFDSDWNPQNDLQAQARAHRIGQKNQVNIYRLVTKASVEEDIVERAKRKMVLDHLVIQRMDTTGRTVLDRKATSPSNATPFNKEELNAILKFGAEELFKDDEDGEDEPACDIDEILRRAETRDEPTGPQVGDELLSAFKVASFAIDEDEPVAMMTSKTSSSGGGVDDDETRDWDAIIPENVRKKIDQEQKEKEMADLYLPPRRGRGPQPAEDDGKLKSRGRRGEEEEESEGSECEASDGDDRPRKRGRPRVNAREIKGFTDAEIRRFLKSFRKFASPLDRLEVVAGDAELQEKPLSELKKLGELILQRCQEALQTQKSSGGKESIPSGEGEDGGKKKRDRGPSLKVANVSINAKTLMSCIQELEPLAKLLPATADERKRWVLPNKLRDAHWDIPWTNEDDSRLLCAIHEYGMGSWEAIKMDPNLGLSDKILPDGQDAKPQAKHLQSRSDYLLKVMGKVYEQQQLHQATLGRTAKPVKKPRKTRAIPTSKSFLGDTENISSDEDLAFINSPTPGGSKRQALSTGAKSLNKTARVKLTEDEDSHFDVRTEDERQMDAKDRKVARKVEKKAAKKKDAGPMHFTANSAPRAIDIIGELDPVIFNECKEKMRPVKKSLKALDNPDTTLPAVDQFQHTQQCLLHIGEHIDRCLSAMQDPERIRIWRNNLWYFVSKFTEFDANKLFRQYRKALKASGDHDGGELKEEKIKHHKDKKKDKERKVKEENRPSGGYNIPNKRRNDSGEHPYPSKRPFNGTIVDSWTDRSSDYERDRERGKPVSSPPTDSRDRFTSDNERDRRDRDRDRGARDRPPPAPYGRAPHPLGTTNYNPHDRDRDRWANDRYSNDRRDGYSRPAHGSLPSYHRDRDGYGSKRGPYPSHHGAAGASHFGDFESPPPPRGGGYAEWTNSRGGSGSSKEGNYRRDAFSNDRRPPLPPPPN